MDIESLKRQAAEKAVESVQSGMIVGLGTGSTAVHATRAIGRLLADGRLHDVLAIPTSEVTAAQAREAAVPLTTLDEHPAIDLTIDGADEIDPRLNLIKGLGGALLREKIVAAASRRFIVVADHRKLVDKLATRAPVPVEIIPFARRPVQEYLESLGARVELRLISGEPYITDESNVILDCYFDPQEGAAAIDDPFALASQIRSQPGVVEHGLFLRLAHAAVIATPSGVKYISANMT